jgi:hypothetical protein
VLLDAVDALDDDLVLPRQGLYDLAPGALVRAGDVLDRVALLNLPG